MYGNFFGVSPITKTCDNHHPVHCTLDRLDRMIGAPRTDALERVKLIVQGEMCVCDFSWSNQFPNLSLSLSLSVKFTIYETVDKSFSHHTHIDTSHPVLHILREHAFAPARARIHLARANDNNLYEINHDENFDRERQFSINSLLNKIKSVCESVAICNLLFSPC